MVFKDGDYLRNGEIYLLHQYEDIELNLKYVERTLPYVYRLWGKNVYLETLVEGKPLLFTYEENKVSRKFYKSRQTAIGSLSTFILISISSDFIQNFNCKFIFRLVSSKLTSKRF